MPCLTENDSSDSDDDAYTARPNDAPALKIATPTSRGRQAALFAPVSPATTTDHELAALTTDTAFDGSADEQNYDNTVPKCQQGRTQARNARTMDSSTDSDERQDHIREHSAPVHNPSSGMNELDALAQSAIERKTRLWDSSHVVQVTKDWNALQEPDAPDDPVFINNWTGSWFDAAPLKDDHTRFSHINT